jgi:hypothetical protein
MLTEGEMTPEEHAKLLAQMAEEIADLGRGPHVLSLDKPGAMAKACEAGAAALRQQGQTCRWTEEEYGEYWESACGETWSFTDGGPAENNARFCHGCGKPLEAVAYEIPLEEAD